MMKMVAYVHREALPVMKKTVTFAYRQMLKGRDKTLSTSSRRCFKINREYGIINGIRKPSCDSIPQATHKTSRQRD
jgi:hypothetical protein